MIWFEIYSHWRGGIGFFARKAAWENSLRLLALPISRRRGYIEIAKLALTVEDM